VGILNLTYKMSRSDSPAGNCDNDMKPLTLNWTPSNLDMLINHIRDSSPSRTPTYRNRRSWSQWNLPKREKRRHSHSDCTVILPRSDGSRSEEDWADAFPIAQSFSIKVSANSHGTPWSNSKQSDEFSFVKASSNKRLFEKYRALEDIDIPVDNSVNPLPGFNFGQSLEEVGVNGVADKKQASRRGSTILKGSNSVLRPSSVEDTAKEIRSDLLLDKRRETIFHGLSEVQSGGSLKDEETNKSSLKSESCWSFHDDLSETNSIILMGEGWDDENGSVHSCTSFQNVKVDWLPSYAQEESCEWQPCDRQARHKRNIFGKEYDLCGEVCAQKLKMRLMQITSWEKWLPRFQEVMAEKCLEKIQYIYDKNGYTPLYFAIMYNYPVLVREILQSMDKTVPDILNPFGLMMACVEGYCEVVEILLESRFPIYCADGIFPTYAQTNNIDLQQEVRLGRAVESSKLKIQALLQKFIAVRKRELATLFCPVLFEHWDGLVLQSVIDVLVEYSLT